MPSKSYSPKKARLKCPLKFRSLPDFTDKQMALFRMLQSNKTKMAFISGPAGTAKTYSAIYTALQLLNTPSPKVGEIIYARSLVQSSPNQIGTLPGELDEKISPYLLPFKEKLNEMCDAPTIANIMTHSRTMPINFMRGANFTDNVVIIDEAQNTTFDELTTIATRIGQHSRLWFLGDPAQSDLKNGHRQDFSNFSKLFDGPDHEAVGIRRFSFDSNDILRSDLCQHVVRTVEDFKK